ncbi:SDR family NAD(P)-dependent oxidoreductase [Frigidibacter sp. MR17.24]|uniref:SDR family NAD(P)-dependent oxidoreductase n=1 Tax=Frigidibacter sp. MR17.24 TaxID=3127345 RepID=UPI0030130AE3
MSDAIAGRRWWLIGASEGLGRALAWQMAEEGAEVVVSARGEARLRDLAARLPGTATALPMDVTDPASVAAAAQGLGPVDGVVWLAGIYWPMRAQQFDPEKAAAMAEVNLGGCLRVMGHVVPAMLAQGHGRIVLTGSLAGYRGLPGAVGYAASKAGVMSLADCLRIDLRGSGVQVQLVNPGFIRTRLTAQNSFRMPGLMEPEQAAQRIVAHIRSSRFRLDFPTGFSRLFTWGRILPDRLWDRIIG